MKTSQLFEVVENREILKLDNPDSSVYKGVINLDYLSSDYDGVFPTDDDWTKFINNAYLCGSSYIMDEFFFGKEKLENQLSGYMVKRETTDSSEMTIVFDDPIEMVVGGYEQGSEWVDIVENINFIRGEVTYEWLWGENTQRASAIDINMDVISYGKY
jgi:hypothetical protein